MPTARPSMTPKIGVVEVIGTTAARAMVAVALMPTPRIAANRGSPAAVKVRSISSRTMAATTMPTISPTPRIPSAELVNACENST